MLQGESIDAIRQELLDGGFSKDDVEYIGHINMGTFDWYIASHPTTLPKMEINLKLSQLLLTSFSMPWVCYP